MLKAATGVSKFTGLVDTPSDYAGQALNIAQVNAGETALEFTGTPTFDSLTLPSLTQGSVPFIGAGGLISEDNDGLFWDAANVRLGIGTDSPDKKLDIVGNARLTGDVPTLEFAQVGGTSRLTIYSSAYTGLGHIESTGAIKFKPSTPSFESSMMFQAVSNDLIGFVGGQNPFTGGGNDILFQVELQEVKLVE